MMIVLYNAASGWCVAQLIRELRCTADKIKKILCGNEKYFGQLNNFRIYGNKKRLIWLKEKGAMNLRSHFNVLYVIYCTRAPTKCIEAISVSLYAP